MKAAHLKLFEVILIDASKWGVMYLGQTSFTARYLYTCKGRLGGADYIMRFLEV